MIRAAHLEEQMQALRSTPDTMEGPSPQEAEAYLRDFAKTWHRASAYGLASEQTDMLHAIYQTGRSWWLRGIPEPQTDAGSRALRPVTRAP